MANRWIARWVRAHRSARAAAFIVLPFIGPIPAATSPPTAADSLSGTWQLSRTCLSGCTGTTTLTETVHPYRGPIFMATGTAPMVLYRIGKRKVLVHAATSSSLLTIRTPGQGMQGKGVSQDGSAVR